jgi:hypothetical protein
MCQMASSTVKQRTLTPSIVVRIQVPQAYRFFRERLRSRGEVRHLRGLGRGIRTSLKKLSFSWPDGPSGLRQLVGRSRKRGFHWHYGVSCWARTTPIRYVRVAGRVVFTADGHNALGDAKRLHRLRRSFCKSWRNDKWRDLLLAFWYWLAEGASFIDTPMGEAVALRLRLPPMIMDAPFGIDSPDDITESWTTKKSKTKRWRAAKRASSPIPKTWTTIHDGAQTHPY